MEQTAVGSIQNRLNEVEGRVSEAAQRSGRDPSDIQIVAVTKGHSIETVRAAYDCGLRWYGENRVRQGLQKMDALAELEGVQWDMIGHIQSRKAKLVVPKYHWVHSVDRIKIARYLNRYAQEAGRRLTVLLECNVSGEEAKYGFDLTSEKEWPAWLETAEMIAEMDGLEVRGLMTMAPWQADEATVRTTFQRLHELRAFLREQLAGYDWSQLSMGMTDDFEIAVEEGATILRLGRALFGPRS